MKYVVLVLWLALLVSSCCKAPDRSPATPNVPAGASAGYVGCSYFLQTRADDPDGDSLSFRFDWGDGDSARWSSAVPSGDTVTACHEWSSAGTFHVRAQARDRDGNLSSWSGSHVMTVTAAWTVALGGSGADWGSSCQVTTDGGFIIAGCTKSDGAGERDGWLVRTDAMGSIIWSKTFGEQGDDEFYSVQQTADGGYVVTGYSSDDALWLVRTDAYGNTVWDRRFGGGAMSAEGRSVGQTADGGFIVAGTWYSSSGGNNVYLLKTDANGDEEWSKTFYGPDADKGACVQQTVDGGYIVVGTTASEGAGYSDVWLIKTTSAGVKEWSKTYGGSQEDEGTCVQQTEDGGYVIAGMTGSYGAGRYDAWVIRTDPDGTELWNRTFGATWYDYANGVVQTPDGGFVVTGEYFTSERGSDLWLLKVDQSGSLVWERKFGGAEYDSGSSVELTQDGGYVVVGTTTTAGDQDVYLVRTGADGE